MRSSKMTYFDLYGGVSFPEANRQIPWNEAFSRSGFFIIEMTKSSHFDMSGESTENRRLLDTVLRTLRVKRSIEGDVLILDVPHTREINWLHAIERNVDGVHEGDWTGTVGIKLWMLDPYIAGVVRWVNAIGIETILSCDGHGSGSPTLDLAGGKETEPLLDLCIDNASGGTWRFRPPRYLTSAPHGELFSGDDPRYSLLNLARNLFLRQRTLKSLLRQSGGKA